MMDSHKQAFNRCAPCNVFFEINSYFPQFLLKQAVVCLTSTTHKYSFQQLCLDKTFWAKFFLLFKLGVPAVAPYVVDGAQYRSSGLDWLVQFNTNSMMTDNRAAVYTCLSMNTLELVSTSRIFLSSVWLERELSDFTGISFFGLIDTRRLLLDYFEPKQTWQTHVSNDKNYDNTLYDIFLVF